MSIERNARRAEPNGRKEAKVRSNLKLERAESKQKKNINTKRFVMCWMKRNIKAEK